MPEDRATTTGHDGTREARAEPSAAGPALPPPPRRPPVFDRRRLKLLPRRGERRGLLTGMRVRKKLIVLHTLFTGLLAAALLFAIRPAVSDIVQRAETQDAAAILTLWLAQDDSGRAATPADAIPRALYRAGSAETLGLDQVAAAALASSPGRVQIVRSRTMGEVAAAFTPGSPGPVGQPESFHALAVTMLPARGAVMRLYLLVVGAVLLVYVLVAVALEVFVLPQNVYGPIRRVLDADRAVQEGRREGELIPGPDIPDDELGAIMRSRNQSVRKLREQEAQLASALGQLEAVASDLKRKNDLIQAAQRNLADADRLVSLGIMSAGIAHELNTPLAVLKGLVEKLCADPRAGMDPAQAALMRRVVERLERLGDGLLDFARVRPPRITRVGVHGIVHEALMLVRLDRNAAGIELVNAVPHELAVACDPDRIVQVLVNLSRNAVDAIREAPGLVAGGAGAPRVVVGAAPITREGRAWLSLTITDDGPGIDAAVLPRLFEPFASTRLDSRGTGLGLAVSEGIVREHGGVLLARNRVDRSGAIFEIVLPDEAPSDAGTTPPVAGASALPSGGPGEPGPHALDPSASAKGPHP